MANPARSAVKRLLLLVAVATSMHCQVNGSGLPGPLGGTSITDLDGSAGTHLDGAATATGGQGGNNTRVDSDARVADTKRPDTSGNGAGASGGSSVSGGNGGIFGNGGIGGTVGSGGAPALDAAPTQTGGTTVSVDGNPGSGSGGHQGAGGATGPGGAGGALPAILDTGTPDEPDRFDSSPLDSRDLGKDKNVVPDLPTERHVDVASTQPDAADAPSNTIDATDAAPPNTTDAACDAGLTLVWSDEFDGDPNSVVDPSKWNYVTWPAGHVNQEKQRYTSDTQNVFLDGHGRLVIRALQSGSEYTSGRIESYGPSSKFSFKTGRIEVKAKLPSAIGSFPGIVMLGTSGGWPAGGEIGLMEQWGQDKSWYYASAYADTSPNSGNLRQQQYDFSPATAGSDDFHVYSADWYSDHLVIQIDGKEVMTTTFGTSSPFYTTPEYIVLDLAVGGTMGQSIVPGDFPTEMVVDYVRVYAF
ncbi:MAG TPA: glycoside hydrolase family 16 protein [Polyangia bacterium]